MRNPVEDKLLEGINCTPLIVIVNTWFYEYNFCFVKELSCSLPSQTLLFFERQNTGIVKVNKDGNHVCIL